MNCLLSQLRSVIDGPVAGILFRRQNKSENGIDVSDAERLNVHGSLLACVMKKARAVPVVKRDKKSATLLINRDKFSLLNREVISIV